MNKAFQPPNAPGGTLKNPPGGQATMDPLQASSQITKNVTQVAQGLMQDAVTLAEQGKTEEAAQKRLQGETIRKIAEGILETLGKLVGLAFKFVDSAVRSIG